MFVLEDGKMVVAGVTSAGIPGCLANGPAIYASMTSTRARDWFLTSFNDLAGRPYSPEGANRDGDCDVCPGFPPISPAEQEATALLRQQRRAP